MARDKYGKLVWFTDDVIMATSNGNYLKRLAKKYNKDNGTKSKFSGPFTEEEKKRFNSLYSMRRW